MNNKELKYYSNLKKKDFRDSENKFLIEGKHLIEECLKSRYYSRNISLIIIRDDFSDGILSVIKNSGIPHEKINANKFSKISETKNSQGIIAVINKISLNIRGIKEAKLIVALDNINDPGNLGTILRTGWWFDVDKIYLSSDSVDLFNSKVIRGSQGAVFNCDIETNIDLIKKTNELYSKGWEIIAADLNTENFLDNMDFKNYKKRMLIFGNEANGVNKHILSESSVKKIKIRGFSECESLNVGVSAGILLSYFKNLII